MVERFTVRSNDVGAETVDDEVLVIDFTTNHYYCLNSTAATIWSMLAAAPCSVEEVTSRIATLHERPADDVRSDIDALVVGLAAEGLLTRSDAPVAASAVDTPVNGPWVVPRFEKFGTLDQLMLAGE